MTEAEPVRMFLVPHTHWDREWYLTFEQFREWLVEMLDGLIGLFGREPGFGHFHLDGQTALIEDYLAVRPEREADLRRLAREGRISVGPWFTQMDEFLTSGESMIRNLEWGLARAKDLAGTEASDAIGYLPDQFGHIGQMPQLLSNAGVRRAAVWRGVPNAVDRTTFRWESPDGSSVLAEYMVFGYSIGARLTQVDDAETLAAELRQAVEWLRPLSVRDRLLVTVGGDHHVPAAKLAPLLRELDPAELGVRAEIASLRSFVDEPDPVDGVPVWRGELRSAARAHLLPHVYSARIRQKQARARAETLLERWAEPFAELMPHATWPNEDLHLSDESPPPPVPSSGWEDRFVATRLQRAWQLLLWNGAHDSVCGCSIDPVAWAVDRRYKEAESLADNVARAAMEVLAARMPRPGMMYVNPSPTERWGIPGLGWKLDADVPIHPSVEFGVDGSSFTAGPFRIRLVDEGDVGDLYNFCPTDTAPPREPQDLSVTTRVVSTRSGLPYPVHTLTAVFDDGLRVELTGMEVPGDEAVMLHGRVMNDRPDHRLRLHVALAEPAERSHALAPFEVVERPLECEGGTEWPARTWPARGAVRAGDVALLQEHVFEYEVLTEPAELAVTLLRCTGTISRPDMPVRNWAAGPDIATPDAQMMGDVLGETPFVVTLARGVAAEELPAAWERFCLPPRATRSRGAGDLPESGSLLRVEGAELSSIRRVDGHLEVRIWNPSTTETRQARVGDRTFEIGPARIETLRLP